MSHHGNVDQKSDKKCHVLFDRLGNWGEKFIIDDICKTLVCGAWVQFLLKIKTSTSF